MEVQNLQVKRNVSAQTAVVGTDQQGKSTKEKASRTGYVHATDREGKSLSFKATLKALDLLDDAHVTGSQVAEYLQSLPR